MAGFMEMASDRELKALLAYNEKTDHGLPSEHLEHSKAVSLVKIFNKAAVEANELRE